MEESNNERDFTENYESSSGIFGKIISYSFLIIVILLLVGYWFYPFQEISFSTKNQNPDFSLNKSQSANLTKLSGEMQFYPNMRYPSSNIDFNIHDCTLKKENAGERAFQIIGNLTKINFNKVSSVTEAEIVLTCDEKMLSNEGGRTYVAGEGGPSKIIRSGDFNVITKGEVLLRNLADCPKPNVAIHEIFHALGFIHSENENNIMYKFSGCNRKIGEEIPYLLNNLYSFNSNPDLLITDATLTQSGRLLEGSVSIKNYGLSDSKNATLRVLLNNEVIEEYDIGPLEIGTGINMNFKTSVANPFSKEIRLNINYSEEEINKENNFKAFNPK